MPDRRVLVVGTTPDYIAYIHERYQHRALFLTDTVQRTGSTEVAPDSASEIVYDLLDREGVMPALQAHLNGFHQTLSGVTCYDCEWLSLAAELAEHFGLPFPSVESVRLSRDKFLTKKRWSERGVRCPRVELVHTGWQALRLIEQFGQPVVLKPLTGTGSELTFLCRDNSDLTAAYRAITDGLKERSELPIYQPDVADAGGQTAEHPVLAEEYVEGREYSSDFVIDGDDVTLIRVAKKIRYEGLPFGTTMAYIIPAQLPAWLDRDVLAGRLREAAKALGFTRAICMVDFIISKDEIVFLELTPRIGGDCLPPLIRRCCGLDTIGFALDFAEGRANDVPGEDRWQTHLGMRLFSPHSGVLTNVSCKRLSDDSRIKEVFIKRALGHEITVPPEDYDSWLLGHVIFEPWPDESLKTQCYDIRDKIIIEVEQYHDQKLAWFHNASRGATQQPGPTA